MRNQLRQSNSLVVPTVWLVFGVLLPCCGVTQWSWCALIEQNLHLLMIGTLLESGHLETVLCMTENRLSLLASHTGKPREEIVKSSAVLQVFEKCSHRHARALENPCTADLPRSLLHPATLTPIKHARSLLEVVWRCKFPAGGNRSLYDVLAVQGGAGARFFLTDQLSLTPSLSGIYGHTKNEFKPQNAIGRLLKPEPAALSLTGNWIRGPLLLPLKFFTNGIGQRRTTSACVSMPLVEKTNTFFTLVLAKLFETRFTPPIIIF
jgi:hypothetical protein